MNGFNVHLFLVFIGIAIMSCAKKPVFSGFDYDPENVTDTKNRKVVENERRSFEFERHQIRFSTDFLGARATEVALRSGGAFWVDIKPEIQPINNSPWYAFRIDSDISQEIELVLRYEQARHRYLPKISFDKKNWAPIDPTALSYENGIARFSVIVNASKPMWISAQELYTSIDLEAWLARISSNKGVKRTSLGTSAKGREIPMLLLGDENKAKVRAVLLARQHAPEVPASLFIEHFVNFLVSDHPVAKRLLGDVHIVVIPMLNIDGVDQGHWRTNANGVDLNRDWEPFNQPETQLLRYALAELASDGLPFIHSIDFHATDEHVVYPLLSDLPKPNGNITEPWLNTIRNSIPSFDFESEPFGTQAPIFKNWMYKTYKADGITFELNDEIDRQLLEFTAVESAQLWAEEIETLLARN